LSPITTACIAFALIMASALIGMFLRTRLPEHHLAGDSKDVIKLATALVGTMAALVLALLFASTRTSFEHTSAAVSRMTADVVQLDQLLDDYGPQAKPIRAALREEIGPLIDSIWREDAEARGAKAEPRSHNETVLYMLRELAPGNPVQASAQQRALQISTDLAQTRLALSAQPTDTLSHPFIIVLVIWLMFIFAVFSMSSPPNVTLGIVLFLCILSASAAIYLILELGQPFDGLMQISNEALRTALR